MKIAILTETDQVFVEFPEHVFRELLTKLLPIYHNDVSKTLDHIEAELRLLTITK